MMQKCIHLIYLICKWRYKGRFIDDAEVYPLNPKTKLGFGDLIDIGVYIMLTGVISIVGAIFLAFYEGEYGVEYYLEEYGTGLFSDFYGMLSVCKWIGIILIVIGAVIYFIGKKTEGPKLKELREVREKLLDERIRELHGAVPKKE